MLSMLSKPTKRFLLAVILIYSIAFFFSYPDLKGVESNLLCGLLTIGVALACFYMAFRCGSLGSRIASSKIWRVRCCCQKSAALLMYCLATGMLMLGFNKGWAVQDIFIDYWSQMPLEYHKRAWSFLASNWIDVLNYGLTVVFVEGIFKCATSERGLHVQTEIK